MDLPEPKIENKLIENLEIKKLFLFIVLLAAEFHINLNPIHNIYMYIFLLGDRPDICLYTYIYICIYLYMYIYTHIFIYVFI